MAVVIPEHQWHEIDEDIFANNKIFAMKQIVAITDCGLHESMQSLMARYTVLRASAPDRFNCDDKTYWKDYPNGWPPEPFRK
jgi:hypothetical protein